MKDQHTLIKGYRDLSPDEIAMMNRIKSLAAEVELLVNHINVLDEQGDSVYCPDERWLEEGTISLQKGFMFLVRSIAKPNSF